jgi:hypothetical protein
MKLCSEVGLSQRAITTQCDSNSVIFLVKSPTFHVNTKHIDIQYHFVRDVVGDGKGILEKFYTLHNVVDALTKPVRKGKFKWCWENIDLVASRNHLTVCFILPYTLARYMTGGRILGQVCHTRCNVVVEQVMIAKN